jgi:hypothetical protein
VITWHKIILPIIIIISTPIVCVTNRQTSLVPDIIPALRSRSHSSWSSRPTVLLLASDLPPLQHRPSDTFHYGTCRPASLPPAPPVRQPNTPNSTTTTIASRAPAGDATVPLLPPPNPRRRQLGSPAAWAQFGGVSVIIIRNGYEASACRLTNTWIFLWSYDGRDDVCLRYCKHVFFAMMQISYYIQRTYFHFLLLVLSEAKKSMLSI